MENMLFAFSDSRQFFCGKFKIFCGIPGLLLFGCVVGAGQENGARGSKARKQDEDAINSNPQMWMLSVLSQSSDAIQFCAAILRFG